MRSRAARTSSRTMFTCDTRCAIRVRRGSIQTMMESRIKRTIARVSTILGNSIATATVSAMRAIRTMTTTAWPMASTETRP